MSTTALEGAAPAALDVTASLEREARGLLSRLERVKPFALQETMVPAASLSLRARGAVEAYLAEGRAALRSQLMRYLGWLRSAEGRAASAPAAHRRFVFLRLRFNVVLSQFDIFSEALSQRSERDNGVWLAGLDAASDDALALPGYYDPPPVVCHLARGPGAAIRRARTRLPGGGHNPVAVIQVPRERMIGSGIASSLFHEVGHQGAALLGLVPSLRAAIRAVPRGAGLDDTVWTLWDRWVSEIVADLWSVARCGVTSTAGLMSVVSLPRAMVFRVNVDDPHPMPWIRVKLSAAMGRALYPHPQWAGLADLWEQYYPRAGLDPERLRLLYALEAHIPRLVDLLVSHRPSSLRGRTLAEAMGTGARQPRHLAALLRAWRLFPERMRAAPPSLAFAVIGQARVRNEITPEEEGALLAELLQHWALRGALHTGARRAHTTTTHRGPTPLFAAG